MDIGHVAYHRHQVLIAFGPAFDDGIAVFRILVGDALNDAAQMIHHFSPGIST